MLVLSRKSGEKIVLPQLGVTLLVVSVRGERVRIGIDAPTEIQVYRQEIWDRMTHETVATPQHTAMQP